MRLSHWQIYPRARRDHLFRYFGERARGKPRRRDAVHLKYAKWSNMAQIHLRARAQCLFTLIQSSRFDIKSRAFLTSKCGEMNLFAFTSSVKSVLIFMPCVIPRDLREISQRMAHIKGFRRIFGRVGFKKCLWKFHSRQSDAEDYLHSGITAALQ
jgi:hypothetical protein